MGPVVDTYGKRFGFLACAHMTFPCGRTTRSASSTGIPSADPVATTASATFAAKRADGRPALARQNAHAVKPCLIGASSRGTRPRRAIKLHVEHQTAFTRETPREFAVAIAGQGADPFGDPMSRIPLGVGRAWIHLRGLPQKSIEQINDANSDPVESQSWRGAERFPAGVTWSHSWKL